MDVVDAILQNGPTTFFIGLITAIGLIVHVRRFTPATVSLMPTILTMLGILGTFYGVSVGLVAFDVKNIQESIPQLLGGIRTAFFASLFGVAFAISIKARYALFGAQSGAAVEGTTIDDLARHLSDVQTALVGDDDSTILSQLKLGRQDVNDRLDALKRSQQEFMSQVAEMNSKALITALEEVIRDFNVKINEQFGENFKQLNVAVGRLLEWQQTYRDQLTELIQAQKETATDMATATERYSRVLEDSAMFANTARQFTSILEAIDAYKTSLSTMTASMDSMLKSAAISVSSIDVGLHQLTGKLSETIRVNEAEIARVAADVGSAFRAAAESMHQTVTTTVENANNQLSTQLTAMSDKLNQQVATLDIALEAELTKALDTLARQLTALSQRFVEDYTPLTERLREIVRAGNV
jgi:hypothetical protein